MWSTKAQYIAVAMVILCGVAMHVAMTNMLRNLVLTRDTYLREMRFPDLFFHFERAPEGVVEKVRAVPGVARVRGRIVRDVTLDVPGNPNPASGRVVSVPWPQSAMLGDIHIVSGRYPGSRSTNEVLVNPKFAEANNLGPGSTFKATVGERQYTLQVSGTAYSPEFILTIRDAASFMPDDKGFGILYTPRELAETLFGYEGAVNDVIVSAEDGADHEVVREAVEDVLDSYGLSVKILRKDQMSYFFLSEEIRGLREMIKVVPVVFLFVAALVIFVMLQRMVKAQRTQIGVLKAFGYSNPQIYIHYVGFAAITCLAGSVPALALGDLLANQWLKLFAAYYKFPILRHRIYSEVYLEALATSLSVCSLAGILATWQVMRIQPAEAMHPAAPPRGHKTIFEQIPLLWSSLGYKTRLILRNLSRQKGRTAFTLVGVVLSTSILLYSLVMNDAITYITDAYFLETQRQDARVVFFHPRNIDTLRDLAGIRGVERTEPVFDVPMELRVGWRKKTAIIKGVLRDSRMAPLVSMTGEPASLPRTGALIGLQLARHLGVKTGDRIMAKVLFPGHEEKELLVGGVFEEGIGLQGYMEISDLSRFLGEPPSYNTALVKVRPEAEGEVMARLKEIGPVSSVLLTSVMFRSMEEAVAQSMIIMIVIFILFAGVISFAIIFNSAVVTMAERSRELASLRVLGFRRGEVAYLLFGEFFLLTLVGIGPGLWLGRLMAVASFANFGTDAFRLPVVIYTPSYLWSAGLVVIFVVLACLAGNRRLKRLDMVEALKARE
jgi:putative ABC transport system permease protein